MPFRDLDAECYWLGCLMALSSPPLQPACSLANKPDSSHCVGLSLGIRAGLSFPGGVDQKKGSGRYWLAQLAYWALIGQPRLGSERNLI